MSNLIMIRYAINEWHKLIRHPKLKILWVLILLVSLGLATLSGQVRSLNPSIGAIGALESKLSLFFWGVQRLVLPLGILTFFVGLQLEYRNQTFFWPGLKMIDEQRWVLAKGAMLFFIYIIVFMSAMLGSYLWLQLTDALSGISNQIVWHWFWEMAIHFILLPLPAFLTMFLAGLISHRYTVALLLTIGLMFAVEQRSAICAPYFALRYSVNLNVLLLKGNALWSYTDLYKHYAIVALYCLFLIILIQYLIKRFGIIRLLNW